MPSVSPLAFTREIERKLTVIVGAAINDTDKLMRDRLRSLKRQAADARLDVRDYVQADTRAEQLEYAESARKRLDGLRSAILVVSESGLISAVDVVQLSAWLDSLREQLV